MTQEINVKEKKKRLNYRKSKDNETCDECSNRYSLSPYTHRCFIFGVKSDKMYSVNIHYVCDSFDGYK